MKLEAMARMSYTKFMLMLSRIKQPGPVLQITTDKHSPNTVGTIARATRQKMDFMRLSPVHAKNAVPNKHKSPDTTYVGLRKFLVPATKPLTSRR